MLKMNMIKFDATLDYTGDNLQLSDILAIYG